MTDEQILAFINQRRPDFRSYFNSSIGDWGGQTGEAGLVQWARAHLSAGNDIGDFNAFVGQQQPAAAPAPAPTAAPSSLIEELRMDPDFAALPAGWQQELAQQIETGGLEGAAAANAAWAAENAGDPSAQRLASWANKATQNAPLDSAGGVPLEQDLLENALPRIYDDIERDAERGALADSLTRQATSDYEAARAALSLEENARRLQEEYRMADETGRRLSDSAATSADEQIAILQQAVAAMQGSLQGEMAERAAALQQQIAALTANLGQLDEAQKAALAQQLTEQTQNLETSIGSQRQALEAELEALRGAATGRTAAQQAALEAELATLRGLNTTEAAARRAALEQEIAQLRTATGEQGAARAAALEAEIAGLTAAQEPLAATRIDTAESLATGINLGLEGERDRLTAQGARRGYIGGSSFEDAALARAAIGARQGAAQVLASAKEANAMDTRSIQGRAATEGRSLADELARNYFNVSGRAAAEGRGLADWIAGRNTELGAYGAAGRRGIADQDSQAEFDIAARGASGQRSLSDALAEGRRGIGDFGAAGRAGIANNTATGRFNIGNTSATQQFQDRVFGAEQGRWLLDALSRGRAEIGSSRSVAQQGARDASTTARQGYFDNAYTRGLQGTLARPGMSATLTNTLTGLDNYANTGLQRALGTLDWWSTNSGTPPTPGFVPVQPSQSGNDLAGLGAGLVGSAFNMWNARPSGGVTAGPTTRPGGSTMPNWFQPAGTTKQPNDWWDTY